jgi:hypothetical protein
MNISTKRRNLLFLLSNLIKIIPENEQQFKEDLEKVRDDCGFTDPDAMCTMWNQSQSIISNKFESMTILPEWSVQFINLWTNK